MRLNLGASHAFDVLLYGEKSPQTLQLLQNQAANIPSTLNANAQAFMSSARQAYDFFNGSAAMNFARTVAGKASRLFQSDFIVPVRTLEEFQQASMVMQRWNMAFPQVRTMYHNQRCDGYSQTYVDMEPGKVGEAHYDWRRVNDGLMVEQNGEEFFVEYIEPLHEGDRHLELAEQRMILRNWDALALLASLKEEDPTSTEGDYL